MSLTGNSHEKKNTDKSKWRCIPKEEFKRYMGTNVMMGIIKLS